ncbi:MAG: hypothetical protein PHD05_06925 [Sphaerochaetaceae bacterium]|nr:hypothetical protein [Sphaerochaetaceae bacterium]
MEKCLIIGDSLDLPRNGVKYSETWICKLKEVFSSRIDIIDKCRWGETTNILTDIKSLELYEPEIIILHLGIVDCAPRKIFEKYIFIEGWDLRKLCGIFFGKVLNKLKLLNNRYENQVVTSLNQFELNVSNYLNRCVKVNVKIVILIAICVPDNRMIKKNSRILKNISKYNESLYSLSKSYDFVKFIAPLNGGDENQYMPDGYHLNSSGNNLILKSILPLLKPYA